jgi:ribosomal protein L40E
VLNWLRHWFVRQSHQALGRELPRTEGPTLETFFAPRATRRPPLPPQHATQRSWAPEPVALHRSLLDVRLAEQRCQRCGASLRSAAVLGVADGTSLDDLGLSDQAAARVLAATERALVLCRRCGASNETKAITGS